MIKVLIVEDEAGIRSSLANAYSWSEMECELLGCAASGIEALEICLKVQPDIIISDIVMPGIDGLTFLKYIKDKYPEIQFIILTGHRNFDYAKDALNIGASYFMLKPINYEELKENICRLASQIVNSNEERETENKQEQVLRRLLNGHLYKKSILTSRVQGLLDRMESFRTAVIQFDGDLSDGYYQIRDLNTFCNDLISDHSSVFVRADDTHLVMIYFIEGSECLSELQNYLLQIQNRIHHHFHKTVSMGVSQIHYGYESLREAYIQSLRSMGKKFFTGNQSVNFFSAEDISENSPQPMDYYSILSFSNKITDLISQSSGIYLAQQAGGLFEELLEPLHGKTDFIRSTFLIVAVLTIKKIFSNDNRQLALLFEKYSNFQKVIQAQSTQELGDLFVELILDLSDYRSIKSSNRQMLIQNVISYISENYQENISLNDAAKKVFLSPSYLSTLVTSETGKSFTDILNETRIQKAIHLLKDPTRKIAEIAYEVGFREPQYFTIAFKKYTELTPRDYRELYLKG